MAEYDNNNRGSIWKNDKKESDKHPDFTGTLNVEGKEYFISAWKRKEGASPKAPALSFSISPKDKSATSNRQAQSNDQNNGVYYADDVPF